MGTSKYYEAMREKAIENIRQSMMPEQEFFTIQLYRGERMFTLGTSCAEKSEAAQHMVYWADVIDADHGHVISERTGEVIISF